jgi:hypothetical protein
VRGAERLPKRALGGGGLAPRGASEPGETMAALRIAMAWEMVSEEGFRAKQPLLWNSSAATERSAFVPGWRVIFHVNAGALARSRICRSAVVAFGLPSVRVGQNRTQFIYNIYNIYGGARPHPLTPGASNQRCLKARHVQPVRVDKGSFNRLRWLLYSTVGEGLKRALLNCGAIWR